MYCAGPVDVLQWVCECIGYTSYYRQMIYCGHYVISLNRKVAMWVNAALAYWGCWAVSGLLDPGLPASVAARPGYYQSFCLFSNTEQLLPLGARSSRLLLIIPPLSQYGDSCYRSALACCVGAQLSTAPGPERWKSYGSNCSIRSQIKRKTDSDRRR